MNAFENPAIVGFAVGLPSFLIAYLAYRRSVKVDKVAEQSGAASSRLEATAQVIAGLNELIDALQEDNRSFREDLKMLIAKLTEITAERDALKKELNRMYRKYGENGEIPH